VERQWRRPSFVCGRELQRRRRRPARAASIVAKETGRVESVRRGLREFWDESKTTRDGLRFMCMKLSAVICKL
jgi:hypothetical protein